MVRYFREAGHQVEWVRSPQTFRQALLETAQECQADCIAFGVLEEAHPDKVHFDQSLYKAIMEASHLPLLTLR